MTTNCFYLPRLFLIFIILLIFTGPTNAEEERIGSEEFRLHCAACHGVGGKGDGSIAPLLNVSPGDLTVISKNNDGVYPFVNIFHIIDGRQSVTAHGDRTMPLWGKRYQAETGDRYGPYGAEEVIRGRILELVYYIQGIQQP